MSIQDSLDHLNQTYFDNLEDPVQRIYVDMELLQDFRLGALLGTCDVLPEIDYIQSCVPEYNRRFDMETAKYFPVLKKTDEWLDETMKKMPQTMTVLSPWTSIYNNFMIVLKCLYMKSKSQNLAVTPLTVVVNCSDIQYPMNAFEPFAQIVDTAYPGVTMKLANYLRYEAGVEFYKSFNMLFLYDHEKFFQAKDLADTLMNDETFKTRTIYTRPYINPKMGLDPSEYAKALTSTATTLNLFFDFFYMPCTVPERKQEDTTSPG